MDNDDVDMKDDDGFETESEEDVSDDEQQLHQKAKKTRKWNITCKSFRACHYF